MTVTPIHVKLRGTDTLSSSFCQKPDKDQSLKEMKDAGKQTKDAGKQMKDPGKTAEGSKLTNEE